MIPQWKSVPASHGTAARRCLDDCSISGGHLVRPRWLSTVFPDIRVIAKGVATVNAILKSSSNILLVSILLISNISPIATYPTPLTPPPTVSSPSNLPPIQTAPSSYTPPVPGTLSPEAEKARARQAMEAVLDKYLRYWGPRYQVAPMEVVTQGEWAHGVAQWQSLAQTVTDPIHILAHRLPNGAWQAVMPDDEGVFLQWVDAAPERLVPALTKNQLRTQAAEAVTLRPPKATPMVPPPTTNKDQSQETVATIEMPVLSTPTPTPMPLSTIIAPSEFMLPLPTPVRIQPSSFPQVVEMKNNSNGEFAPDDLMVDQLGTFPVSPNSPSYNVADSFQFPLSNYAVTGYYFGQEVGTNRYHLGEDGSGNAGTPVYAVANGYVKRIYVNTTCNDYGTAVIVEHQLPAGDPSGSHVVSVYGHLRNTDLQVGIGEVSKGTLLGYLGNYSQNGCWPEHIHFGIRKGAYSSTWVYWGYGNATVLADWLHPTNFINSHQGGGDTTPPDGDFTTPAENQVISNSTVHISGWASDSGSGFNHAHFTAYYNGSWRQIGPDFTASPFGFDWNMCGAGVPDGQVTLGLDIWDNAGNQANSPHGNRHFTKNYNCTTPPNADFDAWPQSGNAPLTVSMHNTSGGDYNSCYWEYGDGSTGTSCAGYHDHTYSHGGSFTVRLTVSGPGGSSTRTRNNYINVSDSCSIPTPLNPNGNRISQGSNVTFSWSGSCSQYYAEYTGGPAGTIGSPWLVATSWTPGQLWCGSYSWRVQGKTSAGTPTGFSSYLNFTVVPNTPTSLTASAASTSQINLAWNDPGGEKDGYKVYYSNGNYIGSTSSTSYPVTGLNCGTSYSFYVKAYKGGFESDASNTASASTLTCPPVDTQSPVVTWTLPVSNTQVYPVGSQTVLLQVDATDNVGIDHVWFVRWDAENLQWVTVDNDYDTPYQAYLDTTTLNIGWNQVNAVANDMAGNRDEKYIWINRLPPQPDLHPYAPTGYPYPVVPSSIPGTHSVNTLYAGQTTYFDWHFKNSGDATASGDFFVELWVDNIRKVRYPYSDYGAGWVNGFDDWGEGVSTPGWHTVTLITDPDNTITEYNESNNTWQRQFYWAPSAPYSDAMENGINEWTASGLWHQVSTSNSPYPASYSPTHSWWYGQDDTGNYNTGTANSGNLTSTPIYIPSTGYYLRFWYRYETETANQLGSTLGANFNGRWSFHRCLATIR